MNAPAVLEHRERKARIFAKDPHGWYVEPQGCSVALADVMDLQGRVWDPACGLGNTVLGLKSCGVKAVGTDLVRRVPGPAEWFLGEHDFLLSGDLFRPEHIVCNPPAKAFEPFVRRALNTATRSVAMFADVRRCFSEHRARGLWLEHPPTRLWFITPRPACPPGDFILAGGKPEGGQADFVWFTWIRGQAPQPPGWLVRPKG